MKNSPKANEGLEADRKNCEQVTMRSSIEFLFVTTMRHRENVVKIWDSITHFHE